MQQRQFETSQANRQQLLDLLGFNQQTLGEGGLLGQPFFGSILGSTAPDLVGGITGAAGLGGGGGNIGQPGFREDPPGAGGDIPPVGGGGGGLFGSQIRGRQQLGQSILGDLSNFGGSHRARINEDFQNVGNSAMARLESRGLGGSSLAPSTMMATERGRQRALGEFEDQLLGQRIGAKQQIGEGIFGDVGREMDRGVERQRIGSGLLGSLMGSALNVASF